MIKCVSKIDRGHITHFGVASPRPAQLLYLLAWCCNASSSALCLGQWDAEAAFCLSELLPLPCSLPFQVFWNFCKREWKHLAINFHVCTKLLLPLDLYAVTPNPTQKAYFIKNSAWATPQRAPTWLELLLWLLRPRVSAWHWPRLCYRVLRGSRSSLQGRARITLLFPGDAHPKHFISMQRPPVTATGLHCFSAKWLTSDFLPKYPFPTKIFSLKWARRFLSDGPPSW